MQQLPPNTTLQGGKYRIEDVLGQGGFGITYLATQVSLNRRVAIKELFKGGEGQAINERRGNQVIVTNAANQQSFIQLKEKFKKEALRLALLNHPNLVKVHDYFEENGTAYFVMDYIEGESLRAKLNRAGRLSEGIVLKYIQQLLPALETAHKQNIWHLDIKPENIMVDRNDNAYLIDFGASKHIEQNRTLTTSLMLAYTPGFCPPELTDLMYESEDGYIEALKDIGPWTDIYALGATMCNLLSDSIPPTAKRIEKNGRNAFLFLNNVSSSTKDLIVWMMKPKREERPQKVDELISVYGKASFNKLKEHEDNRVGFGDNPNDTEVTILSDSEKHEESIIIKEPKKPVEPQKPVPQPAPPTPTWKLIGGLALVCLVLIFLLLIPKMSRNGESAEPINQDTQGLEIRTDLSLSPVLQDLVNNMVRVEGGIFTMGASIEQDSAADDDESPVHQVTLSSFSIGRYEVTQDEWEAVMNNNPSNFKGAKHPVENVSWDDCQMFISKLNELTGMSFRLPTEAEWEYAARGGNRSSGYKYAGSNALYSVAWYHGYSGGATHEVGRKTANELGLYDMSGNVGEWCFDWYGIYSSSAQTNPKGPSSGSFRVYRGGDWGATSWQCRVSVRRSFAPSFKSYSLGFRLAL